MIWHDKHGEDSGGGSTVLPNEGLARRLVTTVRTERQRASGVSALMRKFSLGLKQGTALMCMAEALAHF